MLSSFHYKTNTKHTSNRRAQRPGMGVFFESFSFPLGRVLGKSWPGFQDLPLLLPVPCGAMTVIGASTLPRGKSGG